MIHAAVHHGQLLRNVVSLVIRYYVPGVRCVLRILCTVSNCGGLVALAGGYAIAARKYRVEHDGVFLSREGEKGSILWINIKVFTTREAAFLKFGRS